MLCDINQTRLRQSKGSTYVRTWDYRKEKTLGFFFQKNYVVTPRNFVSFLAICQNVPSIKNGQVSGDVTQEGDEVIYACEHNFILVGEKVLKCMSNGKWNSSEPECKGD